MDRNKEAANTSAGAGADLLASAIETGWGPHGGIGGMRKEFVVSWRLGGIAFEAVATRPDLFQQG